MRPDTLMAVLTVISLLAAITAWTFAWKINHGWAEYTKRLIQETEKMNSDWIDFYHQLLMERKAQEDKGKV